MNTAFARMLLTFVGLLPVAAWTAEKLPGPREAKDANVVTLPAAETDPSHPDFLRTHLKPFGLVPLGEPPAEGGERCRFLWVRAFHRAALFELEFQADGTGVYRASLWQAQGGAGWVLQRTRQLTPSSRETHRRQLAACDFFALPFADDRRGMDGSEWYLEVQEGGRYHAVYRWSPEPGALATFGRDLIEAAIESEFLPVY